MGTLAACRAHGSLHIGLNPSSPGRIPDYKLTLLSSRKSKGCLCETVRRHPPAMMCISVPAKSFGYLNTPPWSTEEAGRKEVACCTTFVVHPGNLQHYSSGRRTFRREICSHLLAGASWLMPLRRLCADAEPPRLLPRSCSHPRSASAFPLGFRKGSAHACQPGISFRSC